MHKEIVQGFILGIIVTTLFFGISFLIGERPKENEKQSLTHLQISKEPLKKGIVEVFYPKENKTLEKLAHPILEILVKEYELVEKILEIPQDKILSYQTYGLVFCEDIDDVFLKYTNQGLALVDGILCYPVVGEVGFPFRDPKTRCRMVYNLPKELVKSILKERLKVKDNVLWLVEGIAGYIGFLCWQELDKYAFFNYEYPRVLNNLNPRQETIDITDDETFKKFEDFYSYTATFIIIDLVKSHGQGIISKIIRQLEKNNGKIGSEEVAQVIKELTTKDILSKLKVISLNKVAKRFKLLKSRLLSQ